MTQVVQASELTLHEVKTQLGLQEAEDEQFFSEWQEPLKLTDVEQRSLDQVKADFLYLNQYPMSEEVVKLVVLSPLLKMAGFYSPFRMRTEAPVQIALEDEGKSYEDELTCWCFKIASVLVVESKEAGFSLKAISQALAYMIGNPYPDGPSFGLTTMAVSSDFETCKAGNSSICFV